MLNNGLNIESYPEGLLRKTEKIGAPKKRATANRDRTFEPIVLEVHEVSKFAVLQVKHRTILVMPAPLQVQALHEMAADCGKTCWKEA